MYLPPSATIVCWVEISLYASLHLPAKSVLGANPPGGFLSIPQDGVRSLHRNFKLGQDILCHLAGKFSIISATESCIDCAQIPMSEIIFFCNWMFLTYFCKACHLKTGRLLYISSLEVNSPGSKCWLLAQLKRLKHTLLELLSFYKDLFATNENIFYCSASAHTMNMCTCTLYIFGFFSNYD